MKTGKTGLAGVFLMLGMVLLCGIEDSLMFDTITFTQAYIYAAAGLALLAGAVVLSRI